ncbi:MAG: glycosyltransferase [Chloroflexi bacterium]|nr:glycosyltransferase [Chloroflexota bacterium]
MMLPGPKFSIIIPVAPHREAAVLSSLERLNYHKDGYEVIVEEGYNPSLNRNRGVERARGEILAFADDDCLVDKNWLTAAEAFFAHHPTVEVVGGPQLTPPSDGFFARVSGYVLASLWGAYRMSSRYQKGATNLKATELNLTSANFFIRRRLFDKLAMFDSRLYPNEETELLWRIKRTGGEIAYYPDVVVYHKRRPDFSSFVKQCFNYGAGRARQSRITGTLPGLGVIIPLIFLLNMALLPILSQVHPLFWGPWAVYGLVTVLVSFKVSAHNRHPLAFVLLPFLFFTIHCAYPIGVVVETVRLLFSPRPAPGTHGKKKEPSIGA